jgi:hypothetical protein
MHYITNNPKATNNVFGMFNWIMKEGWLHIPRKRSKEDATKEANSSNTATKFLEKNYSNYFSRALNASRLIFF